jgi:carbon-monoxide dehydrogenase large subunit
VAVVSVERETGCVEVVDYVVASDAGLLINPLIVEGQIHGGVAQGISGALYEHLAYDDIGQPCTQSLLEYVIPTARQVPSMRIVHLATPSRLNPLGVKGVGESGTLPSSAALAAAVEDALASFGVRVDSMPLRPETLLGLMRP